MRSKAKIKVIRKKELEELKAVPEKKAEIPRNSAREIVSNVSSWVNDLQRRKRAETKEALDKLFPANPQTDSV